MVNVIFLTIITWSHPDLPADSLRMETINGKMFIIHQVSEHETLYGISRRYGTPITSILEFNPTAGSGLETGQLMKIPYVPRAKVQTAEGTIHKVAAKETLFFISKLYDVSVDDLKTWNNLSNNTLSLGQELIIKKKSSVMKQPAEPQETKTTPGTYLVEGKETLYSIARKWGVTVQQLKDWNSLPGDEVKVGQLLIVSSNGFRSVNKVEVKSEEVKQPVLGKEEVKQENRDNTVRVSERVFGSDEVKEGGLAELIEGTEGNRKYLALHRTAKEGTILKVRNELNNREVFVRVVGPLPETGINDKLVIKISKSAYDRLGAIDPKFRVEVTYYK